jgi:hypothetical protein
VFVRKMMVSISSTLAVGVLIGAPATATGQAVGSDSVRGGARECIPFPEPFPGQEPCERTLVLNVDVDSGPAGENPAGTVTWDDLGITPGGTTRSETTATCLAVTGHVAIIGVTGTWQRFGATGFQLQIAGLVRVVDGGGPDSSADTFQSAITTGPEGGPPLPGPTSCSAFPGGFPVGPQPPFFFPSFTNQTGDVIVADARRFPTAKDQCKNGGWRTYGVFKNQGDCVSFVATGGKNPPANGP